MGVISYAFVKLGPILIHTQLHTAYKKKRWKIMIKENKTVSPFLILLFFCFLTPPGPRTLNSPIHASIIPISSSSSSSTNCQNHEPVGRHHPGQNGPYHWTAAWARAVARTPVAVIALGFVTATVIKAVLRRALTLRRVRRSQQRQCRRHHHHPLGWHHRRRAGTRSTWFSMTSSTSLPSPPTSPNHAGRV